MAINALPSPNVTFKRVINKRYVFFFKPTLDYSLVLMAFPIALPLFLLIALGIKITSKGPILHYSKRIKKDGVIFTCYKFRTMKIHSDQALEEALKQNPKLQEEWSCHHKLKKDPRITAFGAFLRKTSLDELPQIFNVIKGDMSFVGPRPYSVIQKDGNLNHELYQQGTKAYAPLFLVKPGITGLWQVSGRSLLPLKKRIQLDNYYVFHASFSLDISILLRTIYAVLSCKGAF